MHAGIRLAGCIAIAVAWLAWSALPVFAYDPGVSLVSENGGKTLAYRALPGQANRVTVTSSADSYVITDSGVTSISAPAECTVSANQVTCPAAGVTLVRVNADDLDDTVTVNSTTPARLFGGTGDDLLISRGGTPDQVDCGTGSDVAAADIADSTVGLTCEQVDLPPDTSISLHPPSVTNQRSAPFSLLSTEQPGDFECQLDAGSWSSCDSSHSYNDLSDGPHTFQARAGDLYGPDLGPAIFSWTVDTTPPQVVIGEPNTSSGAASFSFGGIDEVTASPNIALECKLDAAEWTGCSSPKAYSGLPAGTHAFSVRAIDEAGNSGEGTVAFTITVTGPAPAGSPSPPPPPPPAPVVISKPKLLSLVLISGNAIRISPRRVAAIQLSCSGTRKCAGRVSLATARPVRVAKKRIVTLASTRFEIASGHMKKIKMRLPKKMFRLVKKLKRIPAVVIVRDHDSSGRQRTSTRPVLVRPAR